MPSLIRHPKDFWTGIIFLCLGLAAVIIGRDYPMGTAGRMGPAYFPSVLGGILALLGLIGIVRSFFREGEPLGKFAVKQTALIITGVILFGITVRGAGIVVAIFALVLFSAYASVKFTWKKGIALALGASIFSVIVFVKLLGVPLAVFGPWFGV